MNELHAKGLGLAAISYDSPEILAEFTKRHRITFPLLSDTGSATIRAFGILNTTVDEVAGDGKNDPSAMADYEKYASVTGLEAAARVTGTPYPGTFILDRQGRVKQRFFEEFYRERLTSSTILMKLGGSAGVGTQATKITAAHVEITTYASDPVITTGNRFALAVKVTPAPGVHVYAPGAKGYKVVSLEMASQPWVRVLPPEYPPSEIYFFKPLNERVPVYQKPFTLLQDVVLEASLEASKALEGRKELKLNGTFRYQACDDKECFNPAAVPVQWTLKIDEHNIERITPVK